ncbi:unnamed protein product [Peronospora belbahrii]|uniref:BZIP domain-containing protein n=2 Tax=Peronospora belbahrii TaxID=622444 RepID=A0ABN8CW00_9STRA|nr:unnamed protein product [Peronospora belbahrii]
MHPSRCYLLTRCSRRTALAMPVAYFTPSFDANQKRPLAYTLPGTASLSAYESVSSSSSITVAAATSDNSNAKKSKREIRQMKNRESANKSRLRRKVQLTTLTTEVIKLKKKKQEMQAIIASLRAENKPLWGWTEHVSALQH